MTFAVPFVDPRAHYARLKPEIDAAILGCLEQGDLVYRSQLATFERDLAEYVGVEHAVGVNSGYHALYFALLGAGVGPGDEVITVAHTFVATVSAIVHAGARPVLVDVGDDFDMDPERVEEALTARTRAILPVHLNGRVAPMHDLRALARRHGLTIIEDAAQSLGARYDSERAGALGEVGCFSFYPFKILGGFGDGGALVTNDERIARMASLLRYNGEDRETGEYHYHGSTALLDNVQAAVLSVKLRHLEGWIAHRRRIAARYHEALDGVGDLRLPRFDESRQRDVFQNYVVRCRRRDALASHLREHGVETLVHWRKPMWEHAGLALEEPHLPNTRAICREVLSLPMSAETTEEHVELTCRAIRSFFVSREAAA